MTKNTTKTPKAKKAPKPKFSTREEWLNKFAELARPQFEATGHPLPTNVRISIGFTSGGKRGRSIGECWGEVASKDGFFEIFIRPSLETSERIADVLTHELVHAAVGLEAKHGKLFKQCATALGLTGKMTATVAGEEWFKWARPILKEIGPMPGAPLSEMKTLKKKQTTRMIKCECDSCGFIFRTTRKNIEAHPDMTCPDVHCGGFIMIEGN